MLNLSSGLDDGTQLAINSFAGVDCGKTVPLTITDVSPGTYELNFSEFESFDDEISIELRDAFKGTSINIRNSSLYTFDVTTDARSFGSERFSIVLAPTPAGNFAVTSPTTSCPGTNVKLTLPASQKGYSYSVLMGEEKIASVDGSGKQLEIILPHEKFINGDNFIKIEAQSLTCANVKITSQATVVVEEVQQASIVVVDENTLVSSSETGNSWYLNGTLLPDKTGQYLDVKESGVYRLTVTTGNCSSSVDREFIYAEEGSVTVVYPNPIRKGEVLTVRSYDENLRQVSITNSLGAEIGQVNLERESEGSTKYVGTFDLKEYPSGLYFIKVKDGNKYRIVKIISL
jgi:hypothetical protein